MTGFAIVMLIILVPTGLWEISVSNRYYKEKEKEMTPEESYYGEYPEHKK